MAEQTSVVLEVQRIERRILEVGAERRNDPLLENQISTYVGGLAQQEVRSELAAVRFRFRVAKAQLAAYRDSLEEDFARAQLLLSSEQQECERRIGDARHAATVHI